MIKTVSKLKHKDGTGDRSSCAFFMKMKENENVSASLLPRFVGNRFHVMFHLKGSLFHLKDPLLAMTLCAPNVMQYKGSLGQKGLSDNTKVYFGTTKDHG